MPLGPRLRATAPRTQTRIVLTMLRAVRAARSISPRAAATALAAGTLLLTGACGGDPSPEGGSAGVTAVATTTQVADLVRDLGGRRHGCNARASPLGRGIAAARAGEQQRPRGERGRRGPRRDRSGGAHGTEHS